MPRLRKVDRPRKLTLSLPESLLARFDLLHFSAVEGRVPQGSYQAVIQPFLERYVAEEEQKLCGSNVDIRPLFGDNARIPPLDDKDQYALPID